MNEYDIYEASQPLQKYSMKIQVQIDLLSGMIKHFLCWSMANQQNKQNNFTLYTRLKIHLIWNLYFHKNHVYTVYIPKTSFPYNKK